MPDSNCLLAVGDPLGEPASDRPEPASWSRFILPFAYRRCNEPRPADAPRWFAPATVDDWIHGAIHPDKAKDTCKFFDLARSRYLTHETAEVLFFHAAWFVLRERDHVQDPASARKWCQFSLPRQAQEGGRYTVAFRPPALVLFEWALSVKRSEANADLLQTGFLVLEAFFPDPAAAPSLTDLLRFNELFRYWRRPWAGHEEEQDEKGALRFPEVAALATAWPGLDPPEANDDASEHHRYLGRWSSLLRVSIDQGGGLLSRLALPEEENPRWPAHPGWAIGGDNRTHVVTCAILRDAAPLKNMAADALREWGKGNGPGGEIGAWVKLLNVDPPGETLHGASPFEQEWVVPRTYRRWLHFGTAYGFTDHSLALLSGNPPSHLPICLHLGQMYFDQLLLMLYVRAGLFRFSRELSAISITAREAETRHNVEGQVDRIRVRERFQKLRKDFDWFTNLYRFPLLSTQEQAVEMFEILTFALDVEAIYREVENEVDGTHEVLELETTQHFSRLAALLGILGAFGIFFGIIQTILAFTVFGQKDIAFEWKCTVAAGVGVAVVLFVIYGLLCGWAGRWLEACTAHFVTSRLPACFRKQRRPQSGG